MGSISFGLALVAGRKRVPSPATGNTALRTLSMSAPLFCPALDNGPGFLVNAAFCNASCDALQRPGDSFIQFYSLLRVSLLLEYRNHLPTSRSFQTTAMTLQWRRV